MPDTETPARPPAVVTNASDLTPAMREGLRNWNRANRSTRKALIRRDLVVDYVGELTEAGLRARVAVEALEAGRSAQAEAAEAAVVVSASDLYDAVQEATPALTDVARYVAQLRRWAAYEYDGEWERGRLDAFAMVADQLEGHVLSHLAPVLVPEAVRRDAAAVAGAVTTTSED